MIGSDSHKSNYSALGRPEKRKKRFETFYGHFKILLLVMSYSKLISILHIFYVEGKFLMNH